MDIAVIAALLVALLYGIQIVGEKIYIKDAPDINNQSLVFTTVAFLAIIGFILIPLTPIKLKLSTEHYAIFAITGIIYTITMILWFYAMERENASKVGQLASLEAITTTTAGLLLFNETLTTTSSIAIALIILSIFILVFDRGVARAIQTTKIAVIPILICVILWATIDSTINYISTQLNFWTIYFWIRIAALSCFTPLLLKQNIRTNIKQIFTNNSSHTTTYFTAKLASAIAIILSIYAISNAPLSVVAPILASYPIFALIFGLIATKTTNHTIETATQKHILKRTTSITLFIIGITTLLQTT